MKISNVLLDFDGVILVNSHIVSSVVFARILCEYGLNYSGEDIFRQYLGWRCEGVVNDIEKNLQIDLPVQDIVQRVRSGYAEELLQQPWIDDSLPLLLEKTEGYICSSNSIQFINRILHVTGMKQYFPDEKIYGREMVSSNKPSPEVYCLCMKNNNLKVEECAAFEDSAVGVTAARTAGIFTYGYVKSYKYSFKQELVEKLNAAGANKIVDNFKVQ